MPKKFKEGTRVVLNQEWANWTQYCPSKTHPVGLAGVTVGYCRRPHVVRVKFDSKKTVLAFHEKFLDEEIIA